MDASNNGMHAQSVPTAAQSASVDPIPMPPTSSGAAIPTAAYGQYQTTFHTPPVSRRRVKPIVLAIAFLVMLAAAGVVGVVLGNSTRTPEAQVRRYLGYLSEGRASAATAMVDPGVSNTERVFLTDEVMASATSLLQVEEVVDRNEGSSTKRHTVNATMLVDGIRFTFPFEVHEAEPTLGIIKNWKIQNALTTPVAVRIEDVSTFSVGGVSAPVSDYNSVPFTSPTYLFYPGVYTASAEGLGDYVEAEPVTFRVKRDEYLYGADPLTNVSITTKYSDALFAAALDQMVAQTTSCVTPPGNLETVCPLGLQKKDLTILEVKQMPSEAKQSQYNPDEFHDYAFFKVQSGAGSQIYTLKTTMYATLKRDESGKIVVDSSGKPQFWLRYEAE